MKEEINIGKDDRIKMTIKDRIYEISALKESNGMLTTTTPVCESRFVVIRSGTPCILAINRGDGNLYGAEGFIRGQYFAGRQVLTDIVLTSPPEKIQRRQYYRLGCRLDACGIAVTNPGYIDTAREKLRNGTDDTVQGLILNISGGGALMTSRHDFGCTPQVLLRTDISERSAGGYVITGTELLADILEKTEADDCGFSYRLSFVFEKERDREKLIRFIMNEQIRKRSVR